MTLPTLSYKGIVSSPQADRDGLLQAGRQLLLCRGKGEGRQHFHSTILFSMEQLYTFLLYVATAFP